MNDRFGQELNPGSLVVTACSGYGGSGRLEVGVITKINERIVPDYYGPGQPHITGTVSMIKVTYSEAYATNPARFYEKKSTMGNNHGMIVVQGPDCFSPQFPEPLREKLFALMAEYTR